MDNTTISLNDGRTIPRVGLGTFRAQSQEVYNAVRHALDVGYRHIDTAVVYENETEVGAAIRESGVPREEVFVTTKVWNTAHTREAAATMIGESLARLGLDYVDLLLVHWPWTTTRNVEVYRAMEEAHDAGRARSLGISNFSIHHVESLMPLVRVKPTVNQVECHVYLQNTRLQEYLDSYGMKIEAYAPFMSHKVSELLENTTLADIGKAHGKSITQVVVRWMVQRDIIALPKSVNPQRIDENIDVFDFELSDAEMRQIRALNRARRLFPEPDNVDFGFVEV